jgi:KipI family sensor histidine kinase inhibitor
MMDTGSDMQPLPLPLILPLGDRALLVRFGDSLSDAANRAAIAFGRRAQEAALPGVEEVVPSLVSVLLRYAPERVTFEQLAGEVRLLAGAPEHELAPPREHRVPVVFDGDDIGEVAELLQMSVAQFVDAHCAAPLRVLATGFAPGFLYCGFHEERLRVPRRAEVRRQVPVGTVLFAAGQTAITSTAIPTGWHVIGRTAFRNFDVTHVPPTHVAAGDVVRFEVAG